MSIETINGDPADCFQLAIQFVALEPSAPPMIKRKQANGGTDGSRHVKSTFFMNRDLSVYNEPCQK